MRAFTKLFRELDRTNRTNEKVDALIRYFSAAPPEDAAWAAFFLTGRKIRRTVNTRLLREWLSEESGLPLWLVEECYDAVGDLAETLALLLSTPGEVIWHPLHWLAENRIVPLPACAEEEKRDLVTTTWAELSDPARLVYNKLITGGFRVGVSRTLVGRAIAAVADVDRAVVAHRMMGNWEPTPAAWKTFVAPASSDGSDPQRPYPFYLAYQLETPPAELGDIEEWQAEWKWDGIRAQLLHRDDTILIWTRGEELVTDRYPEIADVAKALPSGTVLDGEILAWDDNANAPLPFGHLQKRIGRKRLTRKLLEHIPVSFMAYDILEENGKDIRAKPLTERRGCLCRLLEPLSHLSRLALSPTLDAAGWQELARCQQEARERRVEGLMLKRLRSPYGVGREKGNWWKWKVDPFRIDAVLTYAQRGHGRRASLYTDYTFGVWHEDQLVTFAKAYSGLSDAEIREVDRFVRQHTVQRFGPVRMVEPELVFEIAFDGIRRSTRHKSGVAVRFPRMARWRRDKPPEEADSLAMLHQLLDMSASPPPVDMDFLT